MAQRDLRTDPNTEAFQMRAQWKKAEGCREMWVSRWNWLVEEQEQTLQETKAIRQEAQAALALAPSKHDIAKSLKPVPVTSTGFIGWLSAKPEFQLEIYTSGLDKPPIRLPDAWDFKNYVGK